MASVHKKSPSVVHQWVQKKRDAHAVGLAAAQKRAVNGGRDCNALLSVSNPPPLPPPVPPRVPPPVLSHCRVSEQPVHTPPGRTPPLSSKKEFNRQGPQNPRSGMKPTTSGGPETHKQQRRYFWNQRRGATSVRRGRRFSFEVPHHVPLSTTRCHTLVWPTHNLVGSSCIQCMGHKDPAPSDHVGCNGLVASLVQEIIMCVSVSARVSVRVQHRGKHNEGRGGCPH